MPDYKAILEKIRLAFPTPTTDKVHEAYFIHTILRALDQVDELKSSAPILGYRSENQPSQTWEQIPENFSNVEWAIHQITEYLSGMTVWGHPNAQTNVVPPTTIPSIVGNLLAAIYNPNMVGIEYSSRVGMAEQEISRICASLIGYDPGESVGLFTFGGTGTNFYGTKIGLEKACPGTLAKGIQERVVVIASETAHYCKLSISAWLGIGMDNVIIIPTNENNSMDIAIFEQKLREAIESGAKVAAIVATMGTTDSFGIDPLSEIIEIRNQCVQDYNLEYAPHVHADSVIGWIWSVFNDYDFGKNNLNFSVRTLRRLSDSARKIKHLCLADSIGIDFHKTGFTPYTSSLFLLKKRPDLELINRSEESIPYIKQTAEYCPGIYTLEASRGGAAPLAALANLLLFGKEGYQVLLGHLVEMAEQLRESLEVYPNITCVNTYNHGSVTLFRVYPEGVDAESAFRNEMRNPAYSDQLEQHNELNRKVQKYLYKEALEGRGATLSLTENYRSSSYGKPIVAIKSYIMSPFCTQNTVEAIPAKIQEALAAVQCQVSV
jgi:glutamate/tyrosine decarboxylase-like PLP-dependent enzyme